MSKGPSPLAANGAVVVLGAASPIARSIALECARLGHDIVVAGRDGEELDRIAADLRIRTGRRVEAAEFDAADPSAHARFFEAVADRFRPIAGVVAAFGSMTDQDAINQDPILAQSVAAVNYSGAVSACLYAARLLEEQQAGWIVGIASVAGDRGRPSNYVYGSAKGGFALFLQGLRSRMAKKGVHVLTVKPGFVDTSMTFGKKGVFLAASPDAVAKTVLKALGKGKNSIYVPGFWAGIMRIIKSIPEPVFKKLNL